MDRRRFVDIYGDGKELAREDLDGYCGEVLLRRDEVTYTCGVLEFSADYKTCTLVELFAEAIWGRSHAGAGTRFEGVEVDSLEMAMLVDAEGLPEQFREAVYETRA